MRTAMARWGTRALLVAFAAILTEGLALVGFRVLHVPYDPIVPPYLDDGQRQQIQALIDHQPTYLVFDRALGWAIAPNAVSADGLYRSNAQGLRADHEYATDVPDDRVRVVAYGDSFTHCDDVDYPDSWEVQLEAARPQIEVVNAGVAGYTLDQAFLRFQRDSPPLAADVAAIGFMSENINRIVNVFRPFYISGVLPLAKPRFLLQNDDLVLFPNPLQGDDDLRRLLAGDPTLIAALAAHDYWYDIRPRAGPEDALASVRLLKSVWSAAKRVLPADALIDRHGTYKTSSEAFAITVLLFDRFTRALEARGVLPLIVLFPNTRDLSGGMPHRHAPLTSALRAHGMKVIDLSDAFDQPASSYGIAENWIHYPAPANANVAGTLARYLDEHHLLSREGVHAALARLVAHVTMRPGGRPM
jgi:hypothetical protein